MLKAIDLKLTLESKTILNSVSIELQPRQLIAVLGPNGAGKSTLLKCLSGELSPHSGEVLMDSDPLHVLSTETLALRRAVMPQSVQLDFPFTVTEVVEMGQRYALSSIELQQMVEQSLSMFDVQHLKTRNYLTLSGGEQQRVQLARVVGQLLSAMQFQKTVPGYLLLDECTSSLDLSHQHLVFKVARQLADHHGMGVLMVLHDLNLASQYADQLVLMKQGQVHYQGSPLEVLNEEIVEAIYDFSVRVLPPTEGVSDWPLVLPMKD
ncbi:heme ABC transporter ATP-binding protein [Hydrogenovibrio kuenenii]|uniref:heme ABC transporter ATP-binding protein n=1 Tax=Hydrogenovibrio kuenenii TaxID=63658 RepID=UPI0004641F01|nr:heme ABC transporter ATP-binding protein [Hydrogenovibrio kuenenii]